MIQATSSKLRFLFEISNTPIYQRIICGFRDALVRQGYSVVLVTPSEFKNYEEYIDYIRHQDIDYCVIPNLVSVLAQYNEEQNQFSYELVEKPIIFIHHDAFLNIKFDLERIKAQFKAFLRLKQNSFHFCIEYYNFLDLRELGLEKVYMLQHASEFTYLQPEPDFHYVYDFSFVGHVLSKFGRQHDNLPHFHRLQADYWNRLLDLGKPLAPSASDFAERVHPVSQDKVESLAPKYLYIFMLHFHSLPFRGDLIKRINYPKIDIIGGSPSYLNNLDITQESLEQDNIFHHPPVEDYAKTAEIYAKSKINLNVTSLQFDSAVINRVIDIGAVGGFVLTDWKSDLNKLTSVAQEISYRSIEELNYKIKYYLHPDHEAERLEIAEALHQDIKHQCTYDAVVDYILSKLDSSTAMHSEKVQVDLGCGTWKPEGFIGVDVAPHPNVDVVADLTRRFPFADNSVDMIRAHDVIEHLPDRIHTMNEIWRIAKPNAVIDIRVPSTDGRGAFQDPTHISYWNINSFQYYCVEFPAYHQLCQSYGFKGAFRLLQLSQTATEDQVVHVHAQLQAVKPLGEMELAEAVREELRLQQVNLIACPDWNQPEEELFPALVQLLQVALTHPDRQQMTLLVDASTIALEDADLALSGAMMQVMAEMELELVEGEPEIVLLEAMEDVKWQTLLSLLSGRIALNTENDELIDRFEIKRLPIVSSNSLC